MNSYKMFLKEQHPELYSDTESTEKLSLNENVLRFTLGTLSSESKEHEFEKYCREIVRLTIAPNLIIQTGPTGGGDSKVDSETFPVDTMLSELLPFPEAVVASGERWAFAMSLKQDWRAKVQSDVRKIKEVEDKQHRGYVKVFFLSNQNIPDKKRSDVEDSLRNETGFDVRILDLNWLLEKSLESERAREVTVRELGLSPDFIKRREVGAADHRRSERLNEIEERLVAEASSLSNREKIDLAEEAAGLACALERADSTINGCLDRHYRLAVKYGDMVDKANSIYLYAHRLVSYCSEPDLAIFYEKYRELEQMALDSPSKFVIEDVITLWTVMMVQNEQNHLGIDCKHHADNLLKIEHDLSSDGNRDSTSIEISLRMLSVRSMLGEDPDKLIDDAISLLERSKRYLGIDMRIVIEMFGGLGIFDQCKRYDEAMEIVYEIMQGDESASSLAPLLFNRAVNMERAGRNYDAIKMYSRVLTCIKKPDDKGNYVKTLVRLATCSEKVGLYWFARNALCLALNLAIDMYYGDAVIEQSVMAACEELKYLELQAGRILQSVKLDFLESCLSTIAKTPTTGDGEELFDQSVAASMLLVGEDELRNLSGVVEVLEHSGYLRAAQMTKFAMGHYDERALTELSCTCEEFDGYVSSFLNSAIECLRLPPACHLLEPESRKLVAKVLGCTITVTSGPEWQAYETACTILASLEGFLATGAARSLYAQRSEIDVIVNYDCDQEQCFSYGEDENGFTLTVGGLEGRSRESVSNDLRELLTLTLARSVELMLPVGFSKETADQLADEDYSIGRTFTISDSVTTSGPFIDDLPFDIVSLRTKSEEWSYVREAPFVFVKAASEEDGADLGKAEIQHGAESDFLKEVSHENITHVSAIHMDLWDKAVWEGLGYIVFGNRKPVLALLFANDVGEVIFRNWKDDPAICDLIRVGIVKGVDKEQPMVYRAAITSAFPSMEKSSEGSIVTTLARIKTVEPSSLDHLNTFELAFRRSDRCGLVPAIMEGGAMRPRWDLEIDISSDAVSIMNAWEIGPEDYVSWNCILPADDPVIPEDQDAKVLKDLLERRRNVPGNNI